MKFGRWNYESAFSLYELHNKWPQSI
jgi:hypothetical protein